MDIYKTLQQLADKKSPSSTTEKSKFGNELVKWFFLARYNSEVFKWIEGAMLYYIDKNNLYNYVYGEAMSKNTFFGEIGIPPSTALSRIDMWKFYVVTHGLTLDELKQADVYKLGRALSYLREKDSKEVKRIVKLAERGQLSRTDFLIEIGLQK